MLFKRYLPLLIFIGFLLDAHIADACSCLGTPTVLAAYNSASVVVIARAVSVERGGPGEGYVGIHSTKMVVEKVFKGNLKVGDEMNFGQGGNTDCIWGFERPVGQRFLLYLGPPQKGSTLWYVGACGRSTSVESADDPTEDLLYLSKLKDVEGKTRISGTIRFVNGSDVSIEGRVIRIAGEGKSYEVKTNKNGVYEIYGLPAGKYIIEPEVPAGWKVSDSWMRRPRFSGLDQVLSPKKIPVTLEGAGDVSLDIRYEIDNAIRGGIYDPNGNPMRDVCIEAMEAGGENRSWGMDCTKGEGKFVLPRLPRGSYFLVVNKKGKISGSVPFKTLYYPNVFDRKKAVAIAVREGEFIDDVNIYVPKTEEVITIEGVFLYSDGKPVDDGFVRFEADEADDKIDSENHVETDASGRFSIKVLKGLKGKLHGEMYSYVGEYENCPQLDSLIKRDGKTVKTSAIAIQAEDNLSGLELRYSFPSCKKVRW